MKPIHSSGVDKVTLTTFDFDIQDVRSVGGWQNKAVTQLSRHMDEATYLLTDASGYVIRGDRMYYNSKATGANYTISRSRSGGNLSLAVNFNPSKMAHPYTLAGTQSEPFRQSVGRIEAEMAALSIRANLMSAKAFRIDVAKQATMLHPLHQYEDAFRLLRGGGRMKRKGYEGGYQFHNTQTQCVFYDKVAEMAANKMDKLIAGEYNFMRAEVRALEAKSVGRVLNISTLADLCRMEHNDLHSAYSKQLERKVFTSTGAWQQLTLNIEDEVDLLRRCRDECGEKWWLAYFAMQGNMDAHIVRLGGLHILRKMLVEAGMSRAQSFRIEAEIMKMSKIKAQADKVRHDVTPATLLEELSETFMAA
jgi:hypothetical protein